MKNCIRSTGDPSNPPTPTRHAPAPKSRAWSSLAAALFLGAASLAQAANIVWVSDVLPAGFSGPQPEATDGGFIRLLQAAGHNVIRFNGPDAAATLLTVDELAALNTNDLIIISRAAGSGAWQNPQGGQWNSAVIKPLICMSPYLVRTTGTRMSWFAGDVGPDDTPVPWTPWNQANPIVDYIFGAAAMSGTNTADLFTEPIDRNTSHILGAPVAGSLVIATATFPQENNLDLVATGNAMVLLPPGTTAGGVALPAARMFIAAGSRESATAPNTIGLYTGRENLTPAGEEVWMRAINVMLQNGTAPSTNSGPATIVTQPVSTTVVAGQPATFSITAGGAAPRLIEWQRAVGDGSFTNVPDAFSAFANARLRLPAVALSDDGAQFRAVVSNSLTIVTSDVVTLTVTGDTSPFRIVHAASIGGSDIIVTFNAQVDPVSAVETLSYNTDSPTVYVISATVRPDGRSVTLGLVAPMEDSLNLTVDSISSADGRPLGTQTVNVRNFRLTGVDVGALNPAPGSEVPAGSNSIAVTAGGLDMASTSDIMRLVYQTVDGDFDANVRVTGITGTFDHLESLAKAALVARESTANNSAGVIVLATPPHPGEERIFAHYRGATGGATNLFGPSVKARLPDAWLRIKRVGNDFTTYYSTNGAVWVTIGTANIALTGTLHVGVGTVSHRNGKTVTGTFSGLNIGTPIEPVTLVNPSWSVNDFRASFQTANGVTYVVEYKNSLSDATWTALPSIAGDGTVKTFIDESPPTGSRFYRVRAE